MLSETQKLKYEQQQILIVINLIEDKTKTMFHELQPETDREIHELAWNDRKRLSYIRAALLSAFDL